MKHYSFLLLLSLFFVSCVPVKKYKELEENYKKCQEDEANYKSQAIDYGNKMKELQVELDLLKTSSDQLIKDSVRLHDQIKMLEAEYDNVMEANESLEKKYSELLASGTFQNSQLINDLEMTRVKLQKKEDRLNELEKELNARARALEEKEKRINELESIIASQNESVKLLKDKIAKALLGFSDQGISVEEKDGKIYVSMEAKLLFASGKTNVNSEGKKAIIDLAKILETQEGIDILVEGHTDSDPMKSSSHPRDNWELSVLRATSVVKIMLANSEMNPTMVSASGRSEFHPVDPEDKAKNRRIEIIITPDLSELFELISGE
ncbi:MAG: OmpA family protein [Flavobacteriales bacterium]|nr:OmpA family protein [Flavobacteriales bacterium]